jgi:hypothetical protein
MQYFMKALPLPVVKVYLQVSVAGGSALCFGCSGVTPAASRFPGGGLGLKEAEVALLFDSEPEWTLRITRTQKHILEYVPE